MLSYFKIRNFKSILDVEVNFSYDEGKAPNNYEQLNTIPFLEVDKKNRFVPCMAFYGANASGKSNIVKAFAILKSVLKKGIKDNFFPNRLNRIYNYSSFEIEFFKDKIKYSYYIEYDAMSIRKERLSKDNKILYSIDKKLKNDFINIQTDLYDSKKLNNIIDVECSEFKVPRASEILLSDIVYKDNKVQIIPFLTKVNSNYRGLNMDLTDVYDYIMFRIRGSMSNEIDYQKSLELLSNNKEDNVSLQTSFNKISDILRKMDIDIKRMSFVRKNVPIDSNNEENKNITLQNISSISYDSEDRLIKIDSIRSYHNDINENEVEFNFKKDESNGTQILLSLIGFILYSLENGASLIIDEIDRAIHPMILIQIIKMFKDKDYNKKNAQLIFTCHATDILSEEVFRISEVSFINKNLKDGTTIKRISDYKDKDIRNVTDFRKLYWNGIFGGIPYPYI